MCAVLYVGARLLGWGCAWSASRIEAKGPQSIAGPGVDILRAARIFEVGVLNSADARQNHGQSRYRPIGMLGEDTASS